MSTPNGDAPDAAELARRREYYLRVSRPALLQLVAEVREFRAWLGEQRPEMAARGKYRAALARLTG